MVRTSRRSPFLRGWNDWYADWRASGGVLLDLVIHDFDFLRWALGEVERVYARGVLATSTTASTTPSPRCASRAVPSPTLRATGGTLVPSTTPSR